VIGTINAERKELSGFKARDEELLLVLAGQLGVALEKLHLFEQVKELAARDSLTGLYNRRHFYELGHKEFSRARRYDTDLSAVMLDFDQFKAVNDQYGHAAGDQVLKEFAEVLAANMRASDIAGRYGGDEFAILLPGSDLESTCKFAKRLSKKVKQRGNEILEGKVKVTICLGLAEIDAGCVDVAMLLDRADQALLKAKQEEDGGLSVWGD
jgi:diguanylate cyclase (GGDEF)-like protein